jgi:hypothetical protein
VGDGHTDNRAAFIAALTAAGANGTVNFGPGVFLCSAGFTVNNANIVGAGAGNTGFLPADDTNGAITLTGTSSLSGFTITPQTPAYTTSIQGSAVLVQATGGSISNLGIANCGNVGLYLNGASNFTVSNTNITTDPICRYSGVTVLGCKNVTLYQVNVTVSTTASTSANTLQIGATSGPVSTGISVSNCTFTNYANHEMAGLNGSATNCSLTNNVLAGQGLVISPSGAVSNLTISGNTIYDAESMGIYVFGLGPSTSGITISNNTIGLNQFPPNSSYFIYGINVYGAQYVNISGNSITNYVEAIDVYSTKNTIIQQNALTNSQNPITVSSLSFGGGAPIPVTGNLVISGNTTTNCGMQLGWLILVGGLVNGQPPLTVSFTNNVDKGPDNSAHWFIYCAAPGAGPNSSGNVSMLPSYFAP